MSALPEEAYAAALAGFERMTIKRLDILLGHAPPSHAFAMACGAAHPTGLVSRLLDIRDLAESWRRSAERRPPEQVWSQCREAGVVVLLRTDARFPLTLRNDPAPAPVLFVKGAIDRLSGRRVGIVGTRNATGMGREIATALGRDLAAEGIHIVSGLARGIDGCAHRGALAAGAGGGAGPIAVVASGLDVVYPREHRSLWDAVAERGALVSEAPPGTPPEAYRFPLRNRILAGLSEVLVVVESRDRGGSLITVDEARERGVPVMAVPGSLRNRAAEGTNSLVRDGCAVVTDFADVLVALGLDSTRTGAVAYDSRPRPKGFDRDLLDHLREPRTLDECVGLTGCTLVECAMSLARLESTGWIHQVNGWFERAGLWAETT